MLYTHLLQLFTIGIILRENRQFDVICIGCCTHFFLIYYIAVIIRDHQSSLFHLSGGPVANASAIPKRRAKTSARQNNKEKEDRSREPLSMNHSPQYIGRSGQAHPHARNMFISSFACQLRVILCTLFLCPSSSLSHLIVDASISRKCGVAVGVVKWDFRRSPAQEWGGRGNPSYGPLISGRSRGILGRWEREWNSDERRRND